MQIEALAFDVNKTCTNDVKSILALAFNSVIITPDLLSSYQTFPYDEILNGKIYFDFDAGIILRKKVARSFFNQLDDLVGSTAETVEDFKSIQSSPEDANPSQKLWYFDRLGTRAGWTGKGQTVAVIDTGIDPHHSCLPRDSPELFFFSCEPNCTVPNDFDSVAHGTKCAGLIGARSSCLRQLAVAPDCRLAVGQRSYNTDGRITAVDLFALISWAVSCAKARIISFSYAASSSATASIEPFDPAAANAIGIVARNLRRNDRALFFCAAGNAGNDLLQYPAAAPNVVAVGGYRPDHVDVRRMTPTGFSGRKSEKEDILLGPASALWTTTPGEEQFFGDFGKTSAACAFVAGVAALYMERYPKCTVEQILCLMKCQAELISDPADPSRFWRGVRFPPPHPRKNPVGRLGCKSLCV